jgi:gas vesicle protein
MKVGKFILGLGIGAVAGLLFAPKKGEELREDIKKESLKAYDNLKALTKEDVEAMLGETIETVKKSVDEFDVDEFKKSTRLKLNELEEKLEVFANKVRESDQYSQVKDGVVVITDTVNKKIDEVKTKVLDSDVSEEYLEELENEIDDVEEKIDEMIEEIQE